MFYKGQNLIRELKKYISEKDFYKMWIISIVLAIIEFLSIFFLFPSIYLIFNNEKLNEISTYLENYNLKIHQNDLIFYCLTILLVYVIFKNVFSYTLNVILNKISFGLSLIITEKQLKYFSSLDYINLKSRKSSEIAKDVIAIPIEFSTKIIRPYFRLVSELILITLISITIFLVEPVVLILNVIIFIPILYFLLKKINAIIKKTGDEIDKLRPENFFNIYAIFNGFIDLIISDKIYKFISNNLTLNKTLNNKYIKLLNYKEVTPRILETTLFFGLLLLYNLKDNFKLIINNDFDNLILIFAVSAFKLIPSLNKISNSIISLKEGSYVMGRIFSDNNNLNNEYKTKIRGHIKLIEFKNVKFSFNKTPVFENLNLKIAHGISVGIYGDSGSGKSTFVRLLLGLLNNYKGEIKVNNQNMSKIYLPDFYKKIGYIHQDSYLLNKSIEENIAFGENIANIDQNRVIKCLEMVDLDKLVLNEKNGLKTIVQDSGTNFSGGQRQRLTIARALYKEPDLLILDEATSSLDEDVSYKILDLVNGLKFKNKELTKIIISHKTHELKKCDIIYKIEGCNILKSNN